VIIHIVRKDWRLLWPLVLLLTALQILLGWLSFRSGFLPEDVIARSLFRTLDVAWYVGIIALVAAVVHQDPIPGINQDWLIRPVPRRDLLFAKVLFVAAAILLPMLVVDLLNARGAGFTLSQALGPAAVKECYVLLTLIVPLLALASVTENWPQILVGAAVLLVLFALCLIAASFAIGPGRCPTCGTGLRWIQSLLEHGAVLLGALLILRLQYFKRQTHRARALIVIGVILFAFVQLPWNLAFAIQQRFAAVPGDAAPIQVSFDAAADWAALTPSRMAPEVSAARATRALLGGNSDDAAEFVRRRALIEAVPVPFELPLRVTGMPSGALLYVDRSEVRLLANDGRVLYRSAVVGELAGLEMASADGTSHETIYLPAAVYRQWSQAPVRLEVTYSLALLKLSATYSMAAPAGDLRSAELGRCQSHLKGDASEINLRCKQVGLGPACFKVVLQGPNGQRDPASQDCSPDYRPFAALWSSSLSYYGIDVPVRDTTGLVQYPVATSQIPESRLIMTTYSVRDHFARTVVTPTVRLAQLQEQR
jgi:hypothetical protein